MEINKYNFSLTKEIELLTKEITSNFCTCDLSLINCHACDNGTPKL